MTGLYFLFVVGLWAWISLKLAVKITRKLSSSEDGGFMILFFFLILMAVPVSDEIVGGYQFRALCSEHAVFHFGVRNPEGRLAKFIALSSDVELPHKMIPISVSSIEYHDVATGERIVFFKRYRAEGGALIRLLGISESNSPLVLSSSCSPEDERHETVSRTFKFNVLN
ncbi:MAG: hypothetical protein Q7U16_14360 [Agitococcus sp.]|nr:hypothetical protein [Agitococcus sp.]